MSLQEKYPNLLEKIEETVNDARELVVVDFNYDDVDSDEFDVFDPSEYNYMIYVTERVQGALGEEGLKKLIALLQESGDFQDFYANEIDMYGVMTSLDEEGITERFLNTIEHVLS